MYIDSHAHLYSEEFDADRSEMLQRAFDAGVEAVVLPNVDLESWPRTKALAEAYPTQFYPTIGLHPTYVKEDYQEQLCALEEALTQSAVVAIGEIGLDYYWDTSFKQEQQVAFEVQLGWAERHQLPVILHTRDAANTENGESAIDDAVQLIRQYAQRVPKGVFHSFTGTEQQLQAILDNTPYYIGINGVVSFKNSPLKHYVQRIPLERLLLETDAPYLAPVPQRGKRNESSFLVHTAAFLASCYGISVDELARQTTANARRLFTLDQA